MNEYLSPDVIDDPDATPDRRILAVANQLTGMIGAGELDALPEDTRRILALLPMALMGIAGDVRAIRVPEGRPDAAIYMDRFRITGEWGKWEEVQK